MTVGCHNTLLCFVLCERGFELKGRLVSERRVQALLIVDLCNEAIDPAAGVAESTKALPLTSSALSVFMKLSALALSKGLPGLLMLMVMSRSANLWR